MAKPREKPAETPLQRKAREQREEGERRYREYLESLSPRDRERVPEP